MKNIELSMLKELSHQELINISGGDKFMRDLGFVLGRIGSFFVEVWETGGASPGERQS